MVLMIYYTTFFVIAREFHRRRDIKIDGIYKRSKIYLLRSDIDNNPEKGVIHQGMIM